jgi:hypothetical protein
MKSIVAQQTIIGGWIPNNNETLVTDEAGLVKINTCHYFPEDTTYAVLFREISSINWQILVKLVRAVFEKETILCFDTRLKGLCLCNWNVRFYRAPTEDG